MDNYYRDFKLSLINWKDYCFCISFKKELLWNDNDERFDKL